MEEKVKRSWWPFQSRYGGSALVEATLITTVPIEVAVQKLRGFIADQDAKIVKTNDNELQLIVTDGSRNESARDRSAGDIPDPFEAVSAPGRDARTRKASRPARTSKRASMS